MYPEWISVKDALPEPTTEVLVAIDGHRGPSWSNTIMLVAYMSAADHKFYEEQHDKSEPLDVSFWMPLPPSPKYN